MAKLLINGEAGTGKTKLLTSLDPKTTFVVARDNKSFPVKLPHMMVTEYYDMDTLLYGGTVKVDGEDIIVEGILDKVDAFNERFGCYPETVVFDTVSQVTMDVIEKALQTPNVYGSQGSEITSELAKLTNFMHQELELNGVNIIMLSHVTKDKTEETTEYLQFGQGKFLAKGSFYSTVDESMTLAIEGGCLVAYMKGKNKLARSLLDVPPKMHIESTEPPLKSKKLKDDEKYFVLSEHLQAIIDSKEEVDEWSL